MTQKFYKCKHCGNLSGLIHNAGIPMVCCNEEMKELIPNINEGAIEKHLPIVKIVDNSIRVTIGETLHPMVEDHYFEWVYLQTENGGQRKSLEPGNAPTVTFLISDDKPLAVFAYCNRHGLWKNVIE